jgi:hypothetical protein
MKDKQYRERDIENLDEIGNFYCIHIDAMTREKLHDKSEIAAELAFRDAEIKRLREAIEYAQKVGDGRIICQNDTVAVQVIYDHLDDALCQ